ncbi:serine hydrolase [Micromonospora sonneratiae]|uniref:Beta-lactamase enzyme family protein n=1 Tax=Micromonospora sonneratiae TaxID=1184706 RepID=A0ABW3YDE2_9ACTN
MTPFRIASVVGVLLVFALTALRLLPGSPFAASAAARWGEPSQTTDRDASQAPSRGNRPAPTPTPSPTLPPLAVQPRPVKIDAVGWYSWAMMDTRTGKIVGSPNMAETNTTASLIKAWIGADYLRRAAEQNTKPSQSRMRQVSIMIRDSDNASASALWTQVGGSATVKRMISICKLTDSSTHQNNWSITRLSPRDITRLGACIADGRAAGPTWTDWLLNEMREVRGVGDFGIRKAFPAAEREQIAIKNGWVTRDAEGTWHVNCLAMGDGWTMGVMTRYPASKGYSYGAKICQNVAQQLRTPAATAGTDTTSTEPSAAPVSY